jgi:hypothetical protein
MATNVGGLTRPRMRTRPWVPNYSAEWAITT